MDNKIAFHVLSCAASCALIFLVTACSEDDIDLGCALTPSQSWSEDSAGEELLLGATLLEGLEGRWTGSFSCDDNASSGQASVSFEVEGREQLLVYDASDGGCRWLAKGSLRAHVTSAFAAQLDDFELPLEANLGAEHPRVHAEGQEAIGEASSPFSHVSLSINLDADGSFAPFELAFSQTSDNGGATSSLVTTCLPDGPLLMDN